MTQQSDIILCDEDGNILHHKCWPRQRGQYGQELLAIEAMMQWQNANNQKSPDISGIIVTAGMGSYTGTRIGVSIANALAFAWDIPIGAIVTSEYCGDDNNYNFIKDITIFLEKPHWQKTITPVYNRAPKIG